MIRVRVGLDSAEKKQIALDRLFGLSHSYKAERTGGSVRMVQAEVLDRSIPAFESLQEACACYTGNSDLSGNLMGEMNSSGLTNALGSTMGRLLLQGYNEMDYGLDLLVPPGNRKAISDFKTQERIRVGYFGDLSQVDPENADWPEIASPTDEKVSYSIAQFGNILTLTRKIIKNDDLGFLRDSAMKLGRAARRTLARRIFGLMTANAATTYDSVTWFHSSSHGGNLTATARN